MLSAVGLTPKGRRKGEGLGCACLLSLRRLSRAKRLSLFLPRGSVSGGTERNQEWHGTPATWKESP